MSKVNLPAKTEPNEIESYICLVRGQKVILDQDLAILFGIETKGLNRAFYRNQERFPDDFSFKLSKIEWDSLKYQFGTSKIGRGGRRKLPVAFTEHGVIMVANLLKSDQAIKMSIETELSSK